MLTLQCSCGETYYAEEKYIGSSILCTNTKCGKVIPIAPLSRTTPPSAPVTGHRWNPPVPLRRPRIHLSTKMFVVCGIVVALAIGLTVLARLQTHSTKDVQASNQAAPATPAPSVAGNAYGSEDKALKSPTSDVRPPVVASKGKGGSKGVEPFTSGIEDLPHDPSTEKRKLKPVEPVSRMASSSP